MRRRPVVSALALIALLAGHGAYWSWAADTLMARFEAAVAEAREGGRKLAYDSATVGGYPFALRLTITGARAADPAAGWRWRGPDLHGHAALWAPHIVTLEAPGLHRLAWEEGGETRMARLIVDRAAARLRLTARGRLREVEATLANARLHLPDDRGVAAERFTLTLVPEIPEKERARDGETGDAAAAEPDAGESAENQAPAPTLAFALAAEGVSGPALARLPLDPPLQSLRLAGRLDGALPTALSRAAVAAWRDSGGVIEFDRVAADWGAVRLRGDATVSLDGNLRPLAAGTARIGGLESLVDALIRKGALPPEAALAVTFGFAATARKDPETGLPMVELPLTAQDGHLRLGPLDVAELEPVF